jgi:hypothetical protein
MRHTKLQLGRSGIFPCVCGLLDGLRDTAVQYSDEKVANRDTKVWHGATENGP